MTTGFYNDINDNPGLGKTIIISVCLHAFFLFAVFLLANKSSNSVFSAPVYTVDLVSPKPAPKPVENYHKEEDVNAEKPAETYKKINPVAVENRAKSTPEQHPAKTAAKPSFSKKAIALKKETAVPALKKEKEVSLEDAIKKIQRRVEKIEADETINSTIQNLENKQLEKTFKEIREKVAHKKDIVMPLNPAHESSNKGSYAKEPPQNDNGLKQARELEEKYAGLIADLIHDKWSYAGDIKQGEVAVIAIRIDKTGRLILSKVEKSPGNAMLVESALRAIKKTAPSFLPFPDELGKDFVEIGVCFPECER